MKQKYVKPTIETFDSELLSKMEAECGSCSCVCVCTCVCTCVKEVR